MYDTEDSYLGEVALARAFTINRLRVRGMMRHRYVRYGFLAIFAVCVGAVLVGLGFGAGVAASEPYPMGG